MKKKKNKKIAFFYFYCNPGNIGAMCFESKHRTAGGFVRERAS